MISILYIGSAVLIFFFLFLLSSKKLKNIADRILVAWFSLLFLSICTAYVIHFEIDSWDWLLELTDASAILHGTFAWFYARALTEENFKFYKIDVLHLIPFSIALFAVYGPWFKGETISSTGRNLLMIAKFVIASIYLIFTLKLLHNHRKKMVNYFSNSSDRIELNWLRLLVWGFLFILVISILSQTIHHFTSINIAQFGGFYTNLLVTFFVFVIGYFGFRQTTIFIPEHLLNPSTPEIKEKPIIPTTDQIYQQLLDHMQTQKPHLEPELTLYKLAEQLQFPVYQLSQQINQHSGSNFFDFINQYRVDEVKRRIKYQEAQQKTLLALAFESGFNSKAAFNRAFKKFTGMTPSQYKKMRRD